MTNERKGAKRPRKPEGARLFFRALRGYAGCRKTLFLFYLFSAGAAAVFWLLNGAAAGDVRYCLLLMTAVLIVIVAFDFPAVYARLTSLWEIGENLKQFEQELPGGGDAAERAYRAIAQGYKARAADEMEALSRTHAVTIDYFTLWMHQIKTPIAAMRLLLEGGDASPAQLGRQLFEVERYAELAMQYVRAADIAADLVLAPCPLEPIVRDCIKKYAPLFIGKGLSAEVSPLSLAPVTDAKWFAFLFEQLLSNAVKYTSAGGVRVYAEDGALFIADTGCGIRPEDLARVFEKGFTGGNGRLDRRASGIGLYLTRRVADALGIALTLSSAPGRGTAARLAFPRDPPAFE